MSRGCQNHFLYESVGFQGDKYGYSNIAYCGRFHILFAKGCFRTQLETCDFGVWVPNGIYYYTWYCSSECIFPKVQVKTRKTEKF